MKAQELKAVALKYDSENGAPFISATAKGELARRLLEIARENSVPVVENEALANILSVQEIGSMIPESTWEVVAKIFAWIVENDKTL